MLYVCYWLICLVCAVNLKRILCVVLFCITFLYIVAQMSFVVSNKVSAYFLSDDNIGYIEGNKEAIRYNRFNPVYRINTACYYSSMDSINSKTLIQLLQGHSFQFDYIDSALVYSKEAYLMFPEEPVFSLNYSLAELLNGNIDKAIGILQNFSDNDDNVQELLCVLGLCYEISGYYDLAYDAYCKALYNSPDIAFSNFYRDLEYRDSIMAISVIDTVLNDLQTQFERYEDPIVASKLGILWYKKSAFDISESLLMKAISELPSLNRTWYYLGLIMENKGDKDSALLCYKKSSSLDVVDLLPLKKLVAYHSTDSILITFVNGNKISKQSSRLNRVFGGRTNKYPYIVSDLEQYCRAEYSM